MRKSGILLHISSLPSVYGIGTLGREAYRFIDFLEQAGQKSWQMLPIGPTGYGDSPYQSFSAFAGNPYFVDPETLVEEGWLSEDALCDIDWGADPTHVDYGAVWQGRARMFAAVFPRFHGKEPADYPTFCANHGWWLDEYADFMALKDRFGGVGREDFPAGFCARGDMRGVSGADFYKMQQYFFYRQWEALHAYARDAGIELIGDLPIYVSSDSSDVWAHPEIFRLDEAGKPYEIAGCPPDSFSPDGQRWGNPLYRWEVLAQSDFDWWHRRLCHQGTLFDRVRIDHFRGFESFFVIDAKGKTADGHWEKGPSDFFFERLRARGGQYDVIAEDLGHLTPAVREMLRKSGYSGMKVLQFAFSGEKENDYLPYLCPAHAVMYTGTHDNDTILGWFDTLSEKERRYAVDFMRLTKTEGYVWGMIKTALASAADTVILTMQDILEKDGSARMNTPGVAAGNWRWRMLSSDMSVSLAEKLRALCRLYHRI